MCNMYIFMYYVYIYIRIHTNKYAKLFITFPNQVCPILFDILWPFFFFHTLPDFPCDLGVVVEHIRSSSAKTFERGHHREHILALPTAALIKCDWMETMNGNYTKVYKGGCFKGNTLTPSLVETPVFWSFWKSHDLPIGAKWKVA